MASTRNPQHWQTCPSPSHINRRALLLSPLLRAAHHPTRVHLPPVVKEPPERELQESVLWVLAVLARVLSILLVRALLIRAPELVRVHGVEVGCVGGVPDLGHVGSGLLAEVAVEVELLEEGVAFDVVGAVAAEALLGHAAEAEDEIGGLVSDVGLLRDAEGGLPVDDLEGGRVYLLSKVLGCTAIQRKNSIF